MLGIVIVTHGTLSDGLKNAAEVVVGEVNNIATINLFSDTSLEGFSGNIVKSIYEVNQGDGVIIFTDLISASPFNQSIIAIECLKDEILKSKVKIIAGINFPMLLEAINHQFIGTNFIEVIKFIMEQGKDNIIVWDSNKQNEISNDLEDDF